MRTLVSLPIALVLLTGAAAGMAAQEEDGRGAEVKGYLVERQLLTDGEQTTLDDGSTRYRNLEYEFTLDLSDPRLAKTSRWTWNTDPYRIGFYINPIYIHWGTVVFEDADGAWEGRFSGPQYGPDHYDLQVQLDGSGGHEGLSAFLNVLPIPENRQHWLFEGVIYEGDLPAVPALPPVAAPAVAAPPVAAPPGALLFDGFSDPTLAQWIGKVGVERGRPDEGPGLSRCEYRVRDYSSES